MQQEPCVHSDEQRAIDGAWVSLELYAAIKRGYKVLKIHEVWHYDQVSQYNPELKQGGLFTEYINTFIKMKQEADGWPAWVQTDADQERYVSDYEEHEGVKLDASNIVKNPGLRALAKLMLNSFWGKFGQRNNKVKTEYFKDPAKYFKHVGEAGRILHSVNIVSDNMVSVSSSFEDDYVEVMANTNTVIAAYTTAQARLKLYSYIEQLGNRLCYFDTDSIIFKSDLTDKNRYQVPIGSYLGDMTDELKDYGQGAYITEFVSSGPKSYAYKVYSPATNTFYYNIKVKGFSLTSAISEKINFNSLKNIVFNYVNNDLIDKIPVKFMQIRRNNEHRVLTVSASKVFKLVYTKRVVCKDFSTVPYGY